MVAVAQTHHSSRSIVRLTMRYRTAIGAQDVHGRTYVISVTCDARRVAPDDC
jgi:hypothetical protein